jgi:hypothetical protein
VIDIGTGENLEGPWEIEEVASSCRLVFTHDELPEGANSEHFGGWPMILSGAEDAAEDRRAARPPARLSS